MSDVHRRAAASAPRLTPEEVATRGFAAAFRGISELEVRNFLKRVAEELALARAREEELIALADDLRDQVKSPPIVTEDRLLDALGEETARVLRSAQESADQIRSRAEEKAHTAVVDAEAAAAATREEADADAAAMRDAAQTAAAGREDEASQYAEQLRATVEAEVEALRAATDAATQAMREESIAAASSEIEASKEAGRELVNEARAVRERILADLGRRRLLLQAQVDELRAGRDRLLDAYRVVKRTLGDATEALVQVEARAGLELSTPPEELNVSPVDGELEALAGHLTGEAGAPSVEVEALFARLRGHDGTPTSPEPDLTADSDLPAPKPTTKPTNKKTSRPTKQKASTDPEPQRSEGEQVGSIPTNPASTDTERTTDEARSTEPEPQRSGGEPRGSVPTNRASTDTERMSNQVGSGGEPRGSVPTNRASTDTERTSNQVGSEGEQRGSVPTNRASTDSERTSNQTERTSNQTDDEARAARAAVLDPLQKELGRKVKRALQDEQNDVLDRLRTVKGRPSASEVLPTPAEQIAVLVSTLRVPVNAAFSGGREAVGATGEALGAPSSMIDGLASAMVERLHARLVEAIDDSGDDDTLVTQRLGARYREFKGQELDAVVGDTLAAAWALGVYDGVPDQTMLRWVPSVEGNCPDCDDNALEPTPRSQVFPTGQPHPPAHPGCRCLLVAVW